MTDLVKLQHTITKIGKVISTKMSKTIVVEVAERVSHPRYRRQVNKRKKFYAHDEFEIAELGDTVRIVAGRPRSRLKRWDFDDVIARGNNVVEFPSQHAQVRNSKPKSAEINDKTRNIR